MHAVAPSTDVPAWPWSTMPFVFENKLHLILGRPPTLPTLCCETGGKASNMANYFFEMCVSLAWDLQIMGKRQ
jgi:hypothetical protein